MENCEYLNDSRCKEQKKQKCYEGGYLQFNIRPACYIKMQNLSETANPPKIPILNLENIITDNPLFSNN